MSITIDSLDIQINTQAGTAAANIDRLAASLGRLKSNAGLTKVTNNLGKLSASLNALNGAAGALSSLERLSDVMNKLGSVQKLSGLSSAFTTLKRLPELMKSIDAAEVTAFAQSMKELADALEPLSTRIDKIARGFSQLPVYIRASVSATNRMTKASTGLNTSSLNLAAWIHNTRSMIAFAKKISHAISGIVADAIEWDGIQYRFGRAFGKDAEEMYEYIQKLNKALGINVQEFMQYSSLYGSLIKGFGLGQDKTTTIAIGATELTYDIWAAYNDRYKTLEDASNAVRSALTGEIEPIRNAGISLTMASLQEYLDGIGMAHIKMENLSDADKVQVRYAAMVNAAMDQGIVGTYASEIKTAEGAVRALSQQTKSLAQGLGSLFIPILSAIIPWVSAFVSLIYQAVSAIAAFFNLPFFRVNWGKSGGMNSVTEGANEATSAIGGAGAAAKELKRQLMGFDELNVLSDPDTGGGGGGGGGQLDSLLDLELSTIWKDVQNQTNEIVDKIKEWLGLNKEISTWSDLFHTRLGQILSIVVSIGIAFGLWKLGTIITVAGGAAAVMGTFLPILKTILWLAIAAYGAISYLTGFVDAWVNGVTPQNIKDMVTGLTFILLGLGFLLGPTAALIVGLVGAIGMLVVGLKDWITTGELSNETALLLSTGLGLIAIALIGPTGGISLLVAALGMLALWVVANWDMIVAKFEEAKQKICSVFDFITGKSQEFPEFLNGTFLGEILWFIRQTINGFIEFKNSIGEVLDWFKTIHIPTFHIDSYSQHSFSILGKTLNFSLPKISFYEHGGFPRTGEMFIAREAGPEMVGSIGGRTAVANNEQIVDSIRQGVYEAVMAANSRQNNQQPVELYLDGKLIADSVSKHQRNALRARGG